MNARSLTWSRATHNRRHYIPAVLHLSNYKWVSLRKHRVLTCERSVHELNNFQSWFAIRFSGYYKLFLYRTEPEALILCSILKNKKIDEQLSQINNLHWLPWIGKNLKKIRSFNYTLCNHSFIFFPLNPVFSPALGILFDGFNSNMMQTEQQKRQRNSASIYTKQKQRYYKLNFWKNKTLFNVWLGKSFLYLIYVHA